MSGLRWLLVMLVAATASCASNKETGPVMKIENGLLRYDHPPLELQVKKEISSVENERSPYKVFFSEEKVSPLFIEFFQTSEVNTLQYYSDLKYLTHLNNLIYVGPAYFGGHEWAKVMHADLQGFLTFGYMTLKGDKFIYIYMVNGIGPEQVRPFAKYQNTRKVPQHAEAFIEEQFATFEEFASIRY